MKQIAFTITGTRPLLQHNEVLANPLSPQAKALKPYSKKREKSDEDYEELARLEFMGGLYINEQGPYIPASAIMRALLDSAKKEKLGPKFKVFVIPSELTFKLLYDGPRNAKGLWEKNFYYQCMVKVQSAKTLRTRPMFSAWSANIYLLFDEDELEAETIARVFTRAGDYGIGDYRPTFGRFEVARIKD